MEWEQGQKKGEGRCNITRREDGERETKQWKWKAGLQLPPSFSMGLQPISFPSAPFPSLWLFGHSHCFLLPKLNWWINCLMLTGWATTAKPIVCLRQVRMHWFFFLLLCPVIFIHIWGPFFVWGTLCSALSVCTRNSLATGHTQQLPRVSAAPKTHQSGWLVLLLSIRWFGRHSRWTLHSSVVPQMKIIPALFCFCSLSYVI